MTKYISLKSIKSIALTSLIIYFIVLLISSLFWRPTHDTIAIHYVAMAIDQFSMIPYKEIYDSALPGAILYHLAIGKVFGYTEFSIALANFLFVILTFFVSLTILKRFSNKARIAGSIMFPIVYFRFGHEMVLQRDAVAVVIAGISFALSNEKLLNKNPILKVFLIGIILGFSGSIKPHMGIGMPIIVGYFLHRTGYQLSFKLSYFLKTFKIYIVSFIGFLIPISCSILWVYQAGGFEEFWWMSKNYISNYIELNKMIYYEPNQYKRVLSKINYYLATLHLWTPVFLFSIFGFILATKKEILIEKSFSISLVLLTFSYSLIMIMSGKFFNYHYMPFYYFGSLFFGTFFINFNKIKLPAMEKFSTFIIIIGLLYFTFNIPGELTHLLKERKPLPPKFGHVDKMVDVLNQYAKQDDLIQPIDWIRGGTVHAMLNKRLKIATPYICVHHFKHHLHEESTQALIEKFYQGLLSSRPKFFLESLLLDSPTGLHTSRDLPKKILNLIKNEYEIIYQDESFILHRKLTL